MEGPILLSTYMKDAQKARLDWLKGSVTGRALEVGCNWGFSTVWIGACAGIDINPTNIHLARLLAPGVEFTPGDARDLPYEDKEFDTVVVPDMLEHLDFEEDVPKVLSEALRVAGKRVLVTFPDGREDSDDATNMKHQWLGDEGHVSRILELLHPAIGSSYRGFICIRRDL